MQFKPVLLKDQWSKLVSLSNISFFKSFIICGCAGSSVWHMGLLLMWLTGPGAHRLSSPWLVGSHSLTRKQTQVPCVGRHILNH